jgi:hypothetical protein
MKRVSAVLLLLSAMFGGSCQPSEEDEPVETCEPSRTMSEACCPELGIDACGAGLVCAALDGRTQPTCYAEFSRLDGSECSEDKLCASRECADSGRCKSSPGAPCVAELGCAEDNVGAQRQCVVAFPGSSLCLRVGQAPGEPCTYNAECSSNNCDCVSVATGLICCEP